MRALRRPVTLGLVAALAAARATPGPALPPPRRVGDRSGRVPLAGGAPASSRTAATLRGDDRAPGAALDRRPRPGGSLEDWAARAFKQWGVGRKGRDDGAVLFISPPTRKLRIEVGYGLEGQLTDLPRGAHHPRGDRAPAGPRRPRRRRARGRSTRCWPPRAARRSVAQPDEQRAPLSLGKLILLGLVGLFVLGLLITHPSLAAALLFTIATGGGRGRGGGFGGSGFGGGGFGGGFSGEAGAPAAGGRRGHGEAMTKRRLLARLDTARIERAIADVERRTRVELRVSIAGLFWGSPQRLAERAFTRLGMSATRDRNAVLLVLAPWRRRLVVLGDEGLRSRVEDSFWGAVVAAAAAELAAGRFTEGVLAAVETVGRALATHFPAAAGANPDELPNQIDRG